jgi:Cytosolic domain of 10TM putative phosphate transporter
MSAEQILSTENLDVSKYRSGLKGYIFPKNIDIVKLEKEIEETE